MTGGSVRRSGGRVERGARAALLLCVFVLACGDAQPVAAPEPESAQAAEEAPAQTPPEETPPAGAQAGEAAADQAPAGEVGAIEDGQQAMQESPQPGSYWLLTEFDWGDDREVVFESTRFDPFYNCRGKAQGICALTQVAVGKEALLAQFHFNAADRLFQMVFLTPDLDREQADAHLRRVWQELVDYVTRHKGEPVSAGELPPLDSLEVSRPQQTHLWRVPGLEVRVMVGRRSEDLYYVGAFFSDPSQPEAREAWLAGLPAADRLLVQRRKQPAGGIVHKVPAPPGASAGASAEAPEAKPPQP